MKQLTIKPKEKGTIIKFGKLPIFTRSLTHWSDMDDVVQLKVEGRYYAIELYQKTQPSPLETALKKMAEKIDSGELVAEVSEIPEDEEKSESSSKTQYQVGKERFARLQALADNGELATCKNRLDICEKLGFERTRYCPGYNWVAAQIRKGVLCEELTKHIKGNSGEYRYFLTGEKPSYSGNKHIQEKAKHRLEGELTDLGFVSLDSRTTVPEPKTNLDTGKDKFRLERGNLSLFEWLNKQDYLVYTMFVYGNGQVSMDKYIDYDDACAVFREAGLPSAVKGIRTPRGTKTAQNTTSMCLALLQRMGILQKSVEKDGKRLYSLTIGKGGQYARGVYRTISEGKYKWDSKKHQRALL